MVVASGRESFAAPSGKLPPMKTFARSAGAAFAANAAGITAGSQNSRLVPEKGTVLAQGAGTSATSLCPVNIGHHAVSVRSLAPSSSCHMGSWVCAAPNQLSQYPGACHEEGTPLVDRLLIAQGP